MRRIAHILPPPTPLQAGYMERGDEVRLYWREGSLLASYFATDGIEQAITFEALGRFCGILPERLRRMASQSSAENALLLGSTPRLEFNMFSFCFQPTDVRRSSTWKSVEMHDLPASV